MGCSDSSLHTAVIADWADLPTATTMFHIEEPAGRNCQAMRRCKLTGAIVRSLSLFFACCEWAPADNCTMSHFEMPDVKPNDRKSIFLNLPR